MKNLPLSLVVGRIALAACFLGFGIWEILAPSQWTSYLPAFLSNTYPIVLIEVHGIALTVTALGVLSGFLPRLFSGIAVFLLLEICIEIFLQEGLSGVFIRDVSLLLFTLSLFLHAVERHRVQA